MQSFWDFVGPLLGLGAEPKNLTFAQISLRGVIIFLITLLMVCLSSKRSLAEKTAFDAIFLVILASVLSRAINGTAGFFASIGRLRSRFSAPLIRLGRVPLACLRQTHQRFPRHYRRKWETAVRHDAAKSYLTTRS